GPAVGEGAVEALDLAVGLRSVGAGLLRPDAELGAGVPPGVGLVGRSVVRQDALDGDAAVGEPGHRPAQDADRGLGPLVVVDLGVGDAGVVVDDRVDERRAQPRLVAVVPAPGPAGRRLPVLLALDAADEPPAPAVGD